MSDDEGRRGSPDDQYINVHDTDELRQWARVLNVTTENLKEVVIKAGTRAEDVRRYLRGYFRSTPEN